MNTQIMKAASLTELGLSAQPILDFMEQHQKLGLHALAVVRGHKVFTLSVKPYKDSFPHTLFSLSKSFCSMAAGIAVGEGLLSYDDKLTEVMKDELPETYDKALDQITLHHLLSMSSGLDERSDHEIRSSLDWVKAALSYPLKRKPGTTFHYNTMGTYLAGRMVPLRILAEERFPGKTRPRWIVPAHIWRGMLPRTSSPLAWPRDARCRLPMPSDVPSRFPSA